MPNSVKCSFAFLALLTELEGSGEPSLLVVLAAASGSPSDKCCLNIYISDDVVGVTSHLDGPAWAGSTGDGIMLPAGPVTTTRSVRSTGGLMIRSTGGLMITNSTGSSKRHATSSLNLFLKYMAILRLNNSKAFSVISPSMLKALPV